MDSLLRSVNVLRNYELGANDGVIGKCSDFLFDDEAWVIRYLVADTRKWLPGRTVLISPISLGEVSSRNEVINVGLSKGQIKDSPPLDSNAPVSRQYERYMNKYYDWTDYWGGPEIWGKEPYPRTLKTRDEFQEIEQDPDGGANLRSAEEVAGYHIHTRDESIGHIDDFLVDEETWQIRYLVIDTSNWLPGSKRVIVDPNWVDKVAWMDRSVTVRMTKEQVENCPEYDPHIPVYRDFEKSVFDHYKFPYYW